MRILHTSDWHLGKTLEGYSRLEEQEQFIDELEFIANDNNVDMIIVSGDIYDVSNPPSIAEKLFYSATKRLSINGKRPILIIAGNHDSPERLTAINPLAYEQSIIILGTPKSIAQVGNYNNYKILSADEGYIEIEVNNEKSVIITLPYPSEKRLNELISKDLDETAMQKNYSDKMGEIFNKLSTKYRDDTINIVTGHFFMLGGEISDSERPIQLGGSLIIEPKVLPEKAQYVALGHLHKSQKVGGTNVKAYYSGSPIQYSKNEITHNKGIYIVDVKPNTEAQIKKIPLKNYKPIEVWDCLNVEEALKKCEENKDREVWVYLNIHTDRTILTSEIREMRTLKKDIVFIHAIINEIEEKEEESEEIDIKLKLIQDLFKEAYIEKNKVEPSQELLDLFIQITLEEVNENEAKTS